MYNGFIIIIIWVVNTWILHVGKVEQKIINKLVGQNVWRLFKITETQKHSPPPNPGKRICTHEINEFTVIQRWKYNAWGI